MNKTLASIIFSFVAVLLCSHAALSQRTEIHNNTKIARANNVYINKAKNVDYKNVLLVNKYIKSNKLVIFRTGATTRFPYNMLRNKALKDGYSGGIGGFGIEEVVKLKIAGNNLFVNCEVRSIDQKIISIVKNNRLIVAEGLFQVSKENYIEVIDYYNIPVLQVILGKDNSIEINGVFFTHDSCFMLNKGNMYMIHSGSPILEMSDKEQKSLLSEILREGRKIKHLE